MTAGAAERAAEEAASSGAEAAAAPPRQAISLASLPMASLVLPELFHGDDGAAPPPTSGSAAASSGRGEGHEPVEGSSLLQVSSNVAQDAKASAGASSSTALAATARVAANATAALAAAASSAASSADRAAAEVLAATGVRTDSADMSWLLVGMVVMGFCYTVTGMCTQIESPSGSDESLAERYREVVAANLPRAAGGFLNNSLPAICGKMLGLTGDIPLLIPVGPLEVKNILEYRAAFKTEVLSRSRKPLFTLTLAQDDVGRPSLMEIRSQGDLLASVDSVGTLFGPENVAFGRLVRQPSGEYVLEEAGSGRTRWLVSLREGGRKDLTNLALTVTWRPKGQLLATAIRGQKPDGGDSEYIKVTNTPGVDMVLVLATIFGVLAFDTIPRIAESNQTLDGVIRGVKDEVRGAASAAMERLHIRP